MSVNVKNKEIDDDFETKKFLRSLKNEIFQTFKKEIEEDERLTKKYNLEKTAEEIQKRKQMQEKFKHYFEQERRVPYNSFWKMFSWLRKHYLNFKPKESYDEYEYAKHMRKNFRSMIFKCMYHSIGYTFVLFLWMRLLKHKGRKDFYYLIMMNFVFAFGLINSNSPYVLTTSRLPLSRNNLENRQELLEKFVYGSNKSWVLTEEIKKISKYYLKEKVEMQFITPTTGQPITFIANNGRLYLSCVDYAEVFGYSGLGNERKKAKLDALNVSNVRDRDIIFGLFKFYEFLTEEFIKQYGIKEYKPIQRKINEKVVEERNLSERDIELLKEFNVVDKEFKVQKNRNEDGVSGKKNEDVLKNIEEKKKFFI